MRPTRQPDTPRRRYVRFTRWRRRHFFAALEESGSVRVAAEAAGVSVACIYRLRRIEPGFVARMAAAVARADARLAGAAGPHPPEADACSGLVIRRGRGGRLRLIEAGDHWWSERTDAVFLGHLRATGNVAGSARAAGFTAKSAWNRRARLPAFARGWDAAMAEAEIRLEQELVAEALNGTRGMEWDPDFEPEPEHELARFDPYLAMWILRREERKRSGR